MLYRFIHRLKARIRKYRAQKKLKKSGYSSWRHYRHNCDTDIFPHADKVSNFYSSKYKYIHRIDSYKHYAYQCVGDYGPGGLVFGYDHMRDWCELKCRFKYRADIHRVYSQTGIGINGETEEDYWFNDIGGTDFAYFAFQDEQDYIHFMLRYS